MKKIQEFTEPAGFMRVRQVRVREIADDAPIPAGAIEVPEDTPAHDWRAATEEE